MYFSLYSVCTYKPIHYSSNYQISMVLLHLFINFPCLLSRCLQCENSNWIGFLFKWQACATTGVKPEPWSANILWIDEFCDGGVTTYSQFIVGPTFFKLVAPLQNFMNLYLIILEYFSNDFFNKGIVIYYV